MNVHSGRDHDIAMIITINMLPLFHGAAMILPMAILVCKRARVSSHHVGFIGSVSMFFVVVAIADAVVLAPTMVTIDPSSSAYIINASADD